MLNTRWGYRQDLKTDIAKSSWTQNPRLKKIFKQKKMPTYFTHDNGGRPFKVVVKKKHAKVFKEVSGEWEYEKFRYGNRPIFEFDFAKKFVGKVPSWAEYANDREFDGNSLLFLKSSPRRSTKRKQYEYIFVGHVIVSFKTPTPITRFTSEVGNSDVPDPIAYTKSDYYFLAVLQKVSKKHMKDIDKRNIAEEFYQMNMGTKFRFKTLQKRLY